ncbi:hypothetical protein Rhal01_00113 [Rubritalea halochordaticola]|uniref:TNase-like domain-containing protein n=1 Tax=Rubritalea halochordaticola TaxID=714537 RepID=A0ABP9UW78_9BACT
MAARKQYSGLWLLLAFALAVTAYYLREQERADPPTAVEQLEKFIEDSLPSDGEDLIADKLTEVVLSGKGYDVLKGCALEEHRHNDGDSFHVRHGRDTTEFRLYFVDTPESKYKTYRDGNDNGKRIDEQGKYFSGLSRDQTTAVGMVAKKHIMKLLRRQEFTVVTKWDNVYGPERRYAFVVVDWNGKQVYLHELLVAHGLARIHTRPATLPDNTAASRQREKLKVLESLAKEAKRGGWCLK